VISKSGCARRHRLLSFGVTPQTRSLRARTCAAQQPPALAADELQSCRRPFGRLSLAPDQAGWLARKTYGGSLGAPKGHEAVFDQVLDAAGPLEEARCLEVGCGGGRLLERVLSAGVAGAAGLDHSPDMLALSREAVERGCRGEVARCRRARQRLRRSARRSVARGDTRRCVRPARRARSSQRRRRHDRCEGSGTHQALSRLRRTRRCCELSRGSPSGRSANPQPVIAHRLLTSPASSAGTDENRHHADVSAINGASSSSSSTASTAGRLGLVVRQLLDVLERVPIQPVRAHALGEPPPPLGALLVTQRRLLSRRCSAQKENASRVPRVAPGTTGTRPAGACP
jgi:hypothetical protein